jgi:hypothetical protein
MLASARSPELVEGRMMSTMPWFDKLTTALRIWLALGNHWRDHLGFCGETH